MQLAWGAYKFQANSVAPSYRILNQYTRANVAYMARLQIHVQGELLDSGAAALSLDEQLLRNALAKNYQDLIFYDNNGNATPTSLYNARCISGTTVVDGPNFDLRHGAGPEYVVLRTFNFTVQGDVLATNAGALMLDYRETVTQTGGGPLYVMKRSTNGPPQRQLIYPQIEYAVIQVGSATGILSYPTPPIALAPAFQKEPPTVNYDSPGRTGFNYLGYPVRWQYRMESATPLPFKRTFWPLNQ